MKFICTQENFIKGLSRVVPLAGRNAQLPILQNILLQLKEGVLHLTCTDLEMGVHTAIPGKVETEGSCTVVARKFMDYIQQLPHTAPITLELKENMIWITTTGFQAQFPTTSDDDFPLLPHLSSKRQLALTGEVLCSGLTHTLFAAARDETRPEIHSVYVQGDKGKLYIAATDSFRLAEAVLPLEKEEEPFSFLLPLSTAQEIVRLFSEAASVKLLSQDSHIALESDEVELSSRLVDGKYPDYRQIIPQTFVTTGITNRQALLRALKTLLVFLPRDSRRVQVAVKPKQGVLTLAVGGSEAGAGEVELEFSGEGENLQILFNIQYLLDGIQSITTEDCQIKFVGNTDPAVFSPVSKTDQYMYVVMPIQAP